MKKYFFLLFLLPINAHGMNKSSSTREQLLAKQKELNDEKELWKLLLESCQDAPQELNAADRQTTNKDIFILKKNLAAAQQELAAVEKQLNAPQRRPSQSRLTVAAGRFLHRSNSATAPAQDPSW